MIAPAVTVWPANTFTPSRCACESRPFFDDPSPFLCAICRVLLLRPRAPRLGRRFLGGVGLRLRRSPRLGSRLRLRLGLRLLRGRLRLGLLRLGLARRRPLRLGRAADRLDRDPGQLRAVAAHLLVAALRLELEHLDLLAPEMLDDLHRHGALELRAVGDHLVAARHQHVGRERVARGMRLPVDEELLALLDPVLLAADLDHRIHEPRNGTRAPGDLRYPGSCPAGRACAHRPRRRRPPRRPARAPARAQAPRRPPERPSPASWPVHAAASAAWPPGLPRPGRRPPRPAPRPRAEPRGRPPGRRAPPRRPLLQSPSSGRGLRACRAGGASSRSPRRRRPPSRRPRPDRWRAPARPSRRRPWPRPPWPWPTSPASAASAWASRPGPRPSARRPPPRRWRSRTPPRSSSRASCGASA